MASPFTYTDLSPYEQVAATQLIDQSRRNPLNEMIAAYQAPQKYAQEQAAAQLQAQIQQATLQKMQRPELHNVAGVGLVQVDPTNPLGYKVVAPAVKSPGSDLIETQAGMLRRTPSGGVENIFPFTQTPTGPMQQVVNLEDANDVRFARPDAEGKPPSGFQFSKTMEQPMKPSERISAVKDVRAAHDDLVSKNLFFGKGQVPGSYGIKKKLDAVLSPVNYDFSKLNPQAKQGFVFAANKLRDPTSATLLAEARQIADKAGILDRFNAFVAGYKEGDPLPDQVAKDIYEVVKQTNDALQADYMEDLPYFQSKLKELGEPLEAIGVPVSFSRQLQSAPSAPGTPPPVTPETPVATQTTPVIPPGMKLQRNARTGETRLVPQ